MIDFFFNQQYYILQLLLLRRGRTWPTQFPDNCRNSDAIIRTTEVTFDLRDFLETKTFFFHSWLFKIISDGKTGAWV